MPLSIDARKQQKRESAPNKKSFLEAGKPTHYSTDPITGRKNLDFLAEINTVIRSIEQTHGEKNTLSQMKEFGMEWARKAVAERKAMAQKKYEDDELSRQL